MTLREILGAIRRRKRLVALGTLLALVLGVLLMLAVGTEHEARARVLLVQPQQGGDAEETLFTQQKLNLLAFTYAEIVQSPRFVEQALDRGGVPSSGASVSGDTVKNTSIVVIGVRHADRDVTEAAAESIVELLVTELERPHLDLPSARELQAVILQQPNATASGSEAVFALIAALIAGLALSITGALLLETQ